MLKEILLDASVVVKWLNQDNEPDADTALRLWEQAEAGDYSFLVSDLTAHEVFNALLKGKHMRGAALELAIEDFYQFPLLGVPTTPPIAARAALIAINLNITFYDAVYLAVALERGATLITANPKHQRPIPGAIVIPLAEWQPD